jgi:hypothetical protein
VRQRRPRFPLVELSRPRFEAAVLRGYLVARTDELAVLEILDEGYRLDGHVAVRADTIARLDELDEDEPRRLVIETALALRRQRPRLPPTLDASAMRELLISASDAHDLVAVHHELLDNWACEIGRVRLSTTTTYVLDPIDPGAHWERPRRHRFADVTRVDFGNAYERALALVARAWGHPRPGKDGARTRRQRGARPRPRAS